MFPNIRKVAGLAVIFVFMLYPSFASETGNTIISPESKAKDPTPQILVDTIAPDVVERESKLKPIDMTVNISSLEDWEIEVVEKLVQAASYMDAAHWQQSDPLGETLYQQLSSSNNSIERAAAFLIRVNHGRWDRFKNFEAFVGTDPRPEGGFVFPQDLSRQELDKYIADNPQEKDALLSPYTTVLRDGDRLVAVPYHEVYSQYVMPAADLLDQAADLSQNESLKTYLKLRAQALRTDDYYQADLDWLDLNSRIDLDIGPIESYDDHLTGQKAFYQANVMIVDQEASKTLDQFKQAIPDLQRNLPVAAKLKPNQTSTLTAMEIVQNVYRTGHPRAGSVPVAYSLPNDPKVWEDKGTKKVLMHNSIEARRNVVLEPLGRAILDNQTAGYITSEGYFNWLLMHEITHTLGPKKVELDGQEITVRQALGEYYSPIEEGKADIGGLYSLEYLRDRGMVSENLESPYTGFLIEALRSIRFGEGSAYGLIRSAAWNYFVEKGALYLDPDSGRFHMNMDKMTAATRDLAETLLIIEGNGDKKAASDFLDRYSKVEPQLQALLDKANEEVAVEVVPMYPHWEREQ
ncbi:MAG: hypothetical protein M0Q13_13450 [Methanothrix sp.]|jgi:hypothetical protein|nr:hypothetical protein [Methanothrix sp.]